MARIKKGEDKTVKIFVESSSAPLSLVGYGVVVIVYSNEVGVIGRFSRNAFEDSNKNVYNPITVVDEAGGEIDIVLSSQMTSKANEGALFAVVKLRHAATNTYVEADPIKLGVVVKTVATNVIDF